MEQILLKDRYRLEERLGSGGMAVVYRARDTELERDVAIKVLRERYSGDEEFREQFRQEARAAANLTHPNIVTVHDFGFDRGRLFIVMEHVPGDHLKNLLNRVGHFSIQDTVSLMVQVCAGVGYAHRAGLVHCDIKPHNILITPDKRVKVTDFGIARVLAAIHPEEKAEIVWGSPQYFSPEQAAGFAPSPASDVYSLGVVMYEMLTGQLPFLASSAEELARMHRDTPPPSPRRFNREIPSTLEQILIKVLSKEPASRYRTADQLGRVLINFASSSAPVQPARPAPAAVSPAGSPPAWSNAPAANPHQPAPVPAPDYSASSSSPSRDPLDIDWVSILIALVALIAVGGLVPFYLWVFFQFR